MTITVDPTTTAAPTPATDLPRQPVPDTAPTVEDLMGATGAAGAAIAAVPAGDRRWDALAPLVTALADAARASLGAAGAHSTVGAPPVVRQRDLAVAARGLLDPAAVVVDHGAAGAVLSLARDLVSRCRPAEPTP